MADAGKLILRLTVAILLLFHGVNKLRHGVGFIISVLQAHHLPEFIAYGVFIGEVVAPILLIIGFMTRPAALIVIFNLAMALYLVVATHALALDRQTGAPGGELIFLYIGAALSIALLGSGRFAVSKGQGRWN